MKNIFVHDWTELSESAIVYVSTSILRDIYRCTILEVGDAELII